MEGMKLYKLKTSQMLIGITNDSGYNPGQNNWDKSSFMSNNMCFRPPCPPPPITMLCTVIHKG